MLSTACAVCARSWPEFPAFCEIFGIRVSRGQCFVRVVPHPLRPLSSSGATLPRERTFLNLLLGQCVLVSEIKVISRRGFSLLSLTYLSAIRSLLPSSNYHELCRTSDDSSTSTLSESRYDRQRSKLVSKSVLDVAGIAGQTGLGRSPKCPG